MSAVTEIESYIPSGTTSTDSIGDNDFLPALACSLGILIVGDINVGMVVFSPHGGKNPTMSDVAKNEAYVDTIYTISKNDTIVDYQVKWND